MDQRTREARIMAKVRADLGVHVGGTPSATQSALIERAAWLTLHVAMLDAKMTAPGSMTEHDSRTYLAWSASLVRTLRTLGLKAAAQAAPTIDDLMTRITPSRGIAA